MFSQTHTIDFKGIAPGTKRTDPDGTVINRSECGHVYDVDGPNGSYVIDMRNWDLTPRKKPNRFRNSQSLV
jgi:hypothetical protein